MRDMRGRTIKVGDVVVYVGNLYRTVTPGSKADGKRPVKAHDPRGYHLATARVVGAWSDHIRVLRTENQLVRDALVGMAPSRRMHVVLKQGSRIRVLVSVITHQDGSVEVSRV